MIHFTKRALLFGTLTTLLPSILPAQEADALELPALETGENPAPDTTSAMDTVREPTAEEAAAEAAELLRSANLPRAEERAVEQPSAPADTLEIWRERAEAANLAKASDRVGFSGFIINRGYNYKYLDFPLFLGPDAEGSNLRSEISLRMGVNANAYMRLTTTASFAHDFSGHYLNSRSVTRKQVVEIPGVITLMDSSENELARYPAYQDKSREGPTIFEDLMASVELKTDPVDATLRAGSALWMEGSPLTLWKRDPRPRLAWYYEGYEAEQNSTNYYAQKFFYRRNDLGRLSWPKKAFGGMELDAYRLPGGMAFLFDFAQPANMLPTKPDRGMGAHTADPENLTSADNLGELYYGRLTKSKVYKDITVGANVLWVELPTDIIKQRLYNPNAPQGFVYQFVSEGKKTIPPYYVNPRVFSLDTRGQLSSTLFLQSDIAISMDDSVKYRPYDDPKTPAIDSLYDGRSPTTHAQSKPAPAAYLKLSSAGNMPFEAEVFYASKDFWSPYAMTQYAVPVHRDEMKLGTGTFSYQSNLMGANIKLSPKMSNGFLALTLGQHVQAEKGRDVIRFQHNLIGRDLWHSSSSWSRTDPNRMLDEGLPYANTKVDRRLGDLGPNRNVLHASAQPGGLRGDDLELWEEFAAYDDTTQANKGAVPMHQKYASSLALDWGYYINSWFGYSRPVLVNLYGDVNAIATDLTGLGNTGNTLLWNGQAKLETGISLANTFHVLLMTGMETFKSTKAYRNKVPFKTYAEPISVEVLTNPIVDAAPAPIDYLQLAYGIGFDWDLSQRASLHVRFKYASHADKEIPTNDWKGTFLFGETKVWF